jgi:serine/threonine-protein kinase
VTHISEVAGALAELHARGYVHRDVKPENILLRRNAGRDGKSEAAVLVDFGLVRAERALRGGAGTAPAAGTPGYTPPEAELPGSAVTPAWDVYSLGIVLFEMLHGRPPYEAENAIVLVTKHATSDVPVQRLVDAGVPRDVAAVVAGMTRRDKARRYASPAALLADLNAVLRGDPLHDAAPRPERRTTARAASPNVDILPPDGPRRAPPSLVVGGTLALLAVAARPGSEPRLPAGPPPYGTSSSGRG